MLFMYPSSLARCATHYPQTSVLQYVCTCSAFCQNTITQVSVFKLSRNCEKGGVGCGCLRPSAAWMLQLIVQGGIYSVSQTVTTHTEHGNELRNLSYKSTSAGFLPSIFFPVNIAVISPPPSRISVSTTKNM